MLLSFPLFKFLAVLSSEYKLFVFNTLSPSRHLPLPHGSIVSVLPVQRIMCNNISGSELISDVIGCSWVPTFSRPTLLDHQHWCSNALVEDDDSHHLL